MEAFLVSTGVVAIAEIGDKTQLLALFLAARFRAPLPIIMGILVATLANHGLAAWAGLLVADWLSGDTLRWILGLSFLAMAAWMLVPDKLDDDAPANARFGPFLATLIAFFLVEIGDKTQVATVALSARFQDLPLVTAGTTLGMMLANVPAVLIGDAAATKIPLKLVHGIAAVIFATLGIVALVAF
ncbi:TMEM165/GDT1 family protein [Pseudokordiimonas caeni]|uniref:TMEM165/GDT1 family protein n=1 Tax=Pseudokordiimonas caeni TaxID=2997908 RepID=UPI00281249D9|nr:TMEM165/GDT1 family protein [Pseudokordiimonas caeni]